jgi:phage/plasmid-associated DNA primase
MMEQQAPLLAFIRAECELGAGLKVGSTDLYNRYSLWCTQNQMKAGNHNKFARELKSTLRGRGVVKKPIYVGGNTVNGFEGVALRAVDVMSNVTPIGAAR